VDTFLVDLKHVDSDKFSRYVHGNAALVLDNLKKLAAKGERIVIRVPVIPGFNHTPREMHNIIDFLVSVPQLREMHFIPYHTLGIEKYRMLDRPYLFEWKKPLEHAELEGYIQYAREKGLKTRIGG
jgi:pyruvate formate lyase activating enzyme